MSRASKYLRKKLAEGGMLDLKKLADANPPKPGTGVAGPQLEPQLQQSTAQNMQEAMGNFRANNPETVQTDATFQQAPQAQLPKAQVRMPAQQQAIPETRIDGSGPAQAQLLTPQRFVSPAQAQQATAQPRRAAAAQSSAPSIGDYDNADDYYNAYAQHHIDMTGDYMLDNLPAGIKQQWEDAQTADAVEPQPGDEGRMGGGVNYGGTDTSTTPTNRNTQDTDTGGVTSPGSVSIPETRTIQDIPKVPDPGPRPEWTGGEAQKGRGSAWEAHLAKLNNWNAANAKYQSYLNEVAEVEANLENEKNNSGTDNMANTDDKGLPDTRGGEPADLTGSGGTKTTGVGVPGSSGSGGAPLGIEVTGPTYTTPTVDVASVSEDQKIYRSDFADDDEGTQKFRTAKAKEAQKLVAQGAEQPRRGQFPEGEAGDIQYNAAIQRFRETPLVAEGTVTEDRNVQTIDETSDATAAGASKVDMGEITKQDPKPLLQNFNDTVDAEGNVKKTAKEKYDVAIANWKARTRASAPDDVTASSFDAATVDAQQQVTAATDGTVTQTATATGPTMTERADAADVDAAAVEAAQAAGIDRQTQTEVATAMTAYDTVKQSSEYKDIVERKEQLYKNRSRDPEYQALNKAFEDAKAAGDTEAMKEASTLRYRYNTQIRELENQRIGMLDAAGAQAVAEVSGPEAATRVAQTIGEEELSGLMDLAEERGVDVEDLPEYTLAKQRLAQEGTAAQGTAAQIEGEAPTATAATADYYDADFTPQGGNTEIDGTPAFEKAATRTAQTGEAAERIAQELGDTPPLDLEGRQAITGTAPQGTAAQIGGVPTLDAAKMQAVTGEDRTVAAADMLEVVANVPEDIAAAIVQDPATVEAQIDAGADPKVTAAVAALPTEALVSTQMEGLLAGIETGETPAWARPAVAAIEAQLARRGMGRSTVARDALFNAIIQSALPIAQSNAQALQARAQQNLSNEQQANLQAAKDTMAVRMQNLANRQTAASQTAQMAQEVKVQQGSFDQQAAILSGQQEQQTAMADLQMQQDRAKQLSAQKQQAALAQLDANSRMDLENLRALNTAEAQNMTAEQQTRLKNYETQVNKIIRQADLKQDMEKANLGPALQIELANLAEMNAASKDTMTAEQTERLTAFNALVDFRKTDATMAQQMDMANMSNEQQMELAMLSEKAATDTANFTAENQFRLAQLQAQVARSVRQAELNSRMEEVNLDASLKVELAELSERNATSRAEMTVEQQTRLANLNTLVDFKKTNVAMAQQMEMANLSNEQQIEMAELSDRSATDAANFTEANRFRLQELSQATSILSQNEELRQRADMAKLSSSERIALANLTAKNQADAQSMTAENTAELQRYEKQMGAAQVNAQLAQQMGIAELSNAQQAAMFNAQVNSNLDIKKFDADQQTQLANSAFMQSMTLTSFNAEQQAAMQNATALASMDMATADQATKLAITNAQNFLQMDMANLSNAQQASVMQAQMNQQRLISNAAAQNAAMQFASASENDTNKFMANLGAQIEQFNVSAQQARYQFNAAEENRRAAMQAGNDLEVERLNAQIAADIEKFNETTDFQREQWNAANAQAVEQSNVQWRRQANLADTAAQNAANQQNAQMTYNLTSQELTQVWQQLRDSAAYARQSYENEQQRKAQLLATAIGNEVISTKSGNKENHTAWISALDGIL